MCLIMTEEGWQQLGNGKVCSNHNKLEGVYRPQPIGLVLQQLESRRLRFLAANEKSILEKQQHFSGHNFLEPLYGAFGEKL